LCAQLTRDLFAIAKFLFLDTDRQVATVVIETAQLVLCQFKNFSTKSIE